MRNTTSKELVYKVDNNQVKDLVSDTVLFTIDGKSVKNSSTNKEVFFLSEGQVFDARTKKVVFNASEEGFFSVKDSGGTVTSFPTVGGANTQVIFNDDSALAGAANFTFNKTTSVMTVTGNVAATRVLTDNLLYANGVAYDFQQPAGSNTQVIFNDDGDFGADTNFTFNKDTDTLTSTNIAGLLTTGTQTNYRTGV